MSTENIRSKDWEEDNRKRKETQQQWTEESLIKKAKKGLKKQQKKEVKKQREEEIRQNSEDVKCKLSVCTLSIAVPGSILENAQSLMLKTYLAGQIARAACIYKVDEIIVFDDKGEVTEREKRRVKMDDIFGQARTECLQLAKILQYMECPQYLRRYYFQIHKDLVYAGVLNPLNAPHHLKQEDESLYREGIVMNKPLKKRKGSFVNVGLVNDVLVDKALTPRLRVTVKIPPNQENTKRLEGIIVPPNEPRAKTGIYWGYKVKVVKSLSEVLASCQYEDGYDLTIGTSDKGSCIDEIDALSLEYRHCLIVFGSLAGLEAAVEADPNLDIDDPSLIFHKYLNTCPEQGSQTIRTEEAILITLAELRSKLAPKSFILV